MSGDRLGLFVHSLARTVICDGLIEGSKTEIGLARQLQHTHPGAAAYPLCGGIFGSRG